MLILFITLLCIGLIISIIFIVMTKSREIMFPIFGITLIVASVLTFLCYISTSAGITDVEYLHGKIIDKRKEKVICEHNYVCGQSCYLAGKGNQICTPVYCKMHSFDIDWVIVSDLKNIVIDRDDSQGLSMPNSWKMAKINEPVTIDKHFVNPILYQLEESPFFYFSPQKKFDNLPNYPKIYNYYKFQPLIDRTENSHTQINDFIINWEKDNSKIKKSNIIVVLTNETDDSYFEALMNKWKSVKKNDIILVYGLDADDNILWFTGTTYAKGMDNILMLEKLKTNTYNKQFSINHISNQLTIINDYFNKVSSEKFSEMKSEAMRPSLMLFLVFSILMIVIDSIALNIYIKNNS